MTVLELCASVCACVYVGVCACLCACASLCVYVRVLVHPNACACRRVLWVGVEFYQEFIIHFYLDHDTKLQYLDVNKNTSVELWMMKGANFKPVFLKKEHHYLNSLFIVSFVTKEIYKS